MIFFVRNVPANVSRRQFAQSAQKSLMPRLRIPFLGAATVVKVEILSIQERVTGVAERHGLVWVNAKGSKENLTKRFDRLRIGGRMFAVHLYVKRGGQKDRRRNGYDGRDLHLDRRGDDRRRAKLDIDLERGPYVVGLSAVTGLAS